MVRLSGRERAAARSFLFFFRACLACLVYLRLVFSARSQNVQDRFVGFLASTSICKGLPLKTAGLCIQTACVCFSLTSGSSLIQRFLPFEATSAMRARYRYSRMICFI
jgi:hypothetical protein